MIPWDPDKYLKYGDERTRPALDLVSHLQVSSPRRIVDLGCGPGNSTAVLRGRWPDAQIIGVDNSPEMIEAARRADPTCDWLLQDIAGWHSECEFDVVFSNATLQWLPDHGPLVASLFGAVAEGGALAFQIPSPDYSQIRPLIHEVAHDTAWVDRMAGALAMLTIESLEFYYDCLSPVARAVDMWETAYFHVMESHAAVIDWISSTGLRPFLEALETDEERRRFVSALRSRVEDTYEVRSDGKILFPFRRSFVVAYK